MMPMQLSFHQFKVKFYDLLTANPFMVKLFTPLNKKYRLYTISASLIIGIALYIGVDMGLAEVVRQDSSMYVFSVELLRELGPEYVKASEDHLDMIKKYTRQMEQRNKQRYLGNILRPLFPAYNPNKVLTSAREELQKAVDKANEQEAMMAIRQAGLVTNKLYTIGRRFPWSPFQWFESEDVPHWLLIALEEAFDKFHEHVNKLENAKTLEVAERECRNACIYSREALLLLSLIRQGYSNQENIELFLSDLKQAHGLALDFAVTYESKKKLFGERAENMDFRAKALEALLADDVTSFYRILDKGMREGPKKKKS